MPKLDGPSLLPENNDIHSLVVMLHGFGADGDDLIGLAPFFAQYLPNTAFHSPNGIETCEISPFGRQWFSLAEYDGDYLRRQSETQAQAFEAMYEGAQKAAPVIEEYIQELMSNYDLNPSQVALLGFSQGTMMALHIGMRQTEPFASLVGFSGALVGTSHLNADKTSSSPTLLIHGEADEMLPVHAVELAQEGLQSVGVSPQVMRRPGLPHSIDQVGAEAAAQFLKGHFAQ